MIQEDTLRSMFADRLNSIMHASGTDVDDLSFALNAERVTVRNWVTGKALPGTHYFIELVNLFRVTPGSLLGTTNHSVKMEREHSIAELSSEFFAKLQSTLKERGISIPCFAENYLYITSNTLTYTIKHGCLPNMIRVVEVAEALDLDIDHMLGVPSLMVPFHATPLWEAQYGKEE